jgi:acyltransferase
MKERAAMRLDAIDAARAVGLGLVYYGHFVEQLMYLDNPAAAIHYKWIYSFHMILFFVLSGWIRGARPFTAPFPAFVRTTLASRIAPYLFFSLVMAFISLFVPGWFPIVELNSPDAYAQAAVATAMGFPLFNVPMWFVACLVSVECVHRLLGGLLDTPRRITLAALACYVGGYALNAEYFFFGQNMSFWLLHEVPVVYAFYLVGVLCGRVQLLGGIGKGLVPLCLFAVSLLAVHLTFDLNQGPFRYLQAVVILLSGHGHVLWFPFTALAGSVMVLALGSMLRGLSWLTFLGRNGLILLGMNGFFYHFVNKPLAAWCAESFPGNGPAVFLIGMAVTVACIGACVPVILALNRAMPQLVGKPRQAGLFFGPLLRG